MNTKPRLQRPSDHLFGELWKRPDLSPRDRSIVTLAALIARNQTIELSNYLALALDSGIKPTEISEIITHLAFYSGWSNAMSAVAAAKDVFDQRGIGTDQLPTASPKLLPLDQTVEEKRTTSVQQITGSVSPGLVHYTGELLFRDLWLRPDLAPRDRSLVTVSALIASNQVAQIPFHLNKAMDNGLTQAQASEIITQLAFYAGWPNAFSAGSLSSARFSHRTILARSATRDTRAAEIMYGNPCFEYLLLDLRVDIPCMKCAFEYTQSRARDRHAHSPVLPDNPCTSIASHSPYRKTLMRFQQ